MEERLKSCEEYLERSLKKLEEVQGEVERTGARLARLKEEAASARPVDVTPDLQAEVSRLRAELAEAKGEAREERPRVRQRVTEPPKRGVENIPHTAQELWDWMSRKQHDLQELLEFGGSRNVVFELTSQLADAAERMHSCQDRQNDVVM